ncbi:hypothetical protein [Propionibacterium freudenreichii]|uniref:hypothetical protein n=1 Tax=Propionibacterium freudenreichii TaxID=1744 RepID=UPI0038521667
MTTGNSLPRQTQEDLRRFHTSEELRFLLCQLHEQGDGAWEHDPIAADLMQFVCDKYANLARRHELDPWEAVSAAFQVMRAKSTREARDPWGVITHAVRITCIYEERAQGLLCSVHQARRPHVSSFHDPDRFSTRAHPIVDDHPVLAAIDERYNRAEETGDTSTPGLVAVARAIELLVLLGWPADVAQSGVEQICDALMRTGARHTAYDALRKDKQVRVLLDIPAPSWMGLLRAMLGHPEPMYAATNAGRGVLMRLLIGETVGLLLADDDLVVALSESVPGAEW